jgi:hypothetical protein
VRYGPLSFWLPPPATLPSPPFLSLLPLIVSSLHASLCIVVVGVFVVVIGVRGRLPYVEFSLIPVRTGADFSFTSVRSLFISCGFVFVVFVIVSASMLRYISCRSSASWPICLYDTPGSGCLFFSLRDSRTFMNLSFVVSSARRQWPRPWLRGVNIHRSHISWTFVATWFSNARAGSVLLSINAVPVVGVCVGLLSSFLVPLCCCRRGD